MLYNFYFLQKVFRRVKPVGPFMGTFNYSHFAKKKPPIL